MTKVRSSNFPAGLYLFKNNIRNIKTIWEICLKLIIKTPKPLSDVIIVNSKHVNADFESILKNTKLFDIFCYI